MGKYYAVKIGKKPGIYTSWPETQKQTHGFPGAKFKSFTNKEEALAYMSSEKTPKKGELTYEAYVDGSFNKKNQCYGSGAIILKNGEPFEELSFGGNDAQYLESYQIAGEVLAAVGAMQWAADHDIAEIGIYYDYQGIASWALGEWRTNKAVSQNYVKAYNDLKDKVKVHFIKVKGHSGDKYNDVADSLAKKGANAE